MVLMVPMGYTVLLADSEDGQLNRFSPDQNVFSSMTDSLRLSLKLSQSL
jgi:hypothetical protein